MIRRGVWAYQSGGDDRSFWDNTTQGNVSLYRKMAESLKSINYGGWEVVPFVPLDQGSYYDPGLPNSHRGGQGTWGKRYGYGSSATAGSAPVLKREINDVGVSRLPSALPPKQLNWKEVPRRGKSDIPPLRSARSRREFFHPREKSIFLAAKRRQ